MGDLLGREVCSDVAEIVVHVETDATMQIDASRACFIAPLEEVWENVSPNFAIDAVQWLPGDAGCADVAALAIKAAAVFAALVAGLDDRRVKGTKLRLFKRWLKGNFMSMETELK